MSDTLDFTNLVGIIPDDQQEDENDLLGSISYTDSIIMNTDWTIETLFLQISKGNIDLEPAFQRRSAWDNIRKSRLIESIIVGMPVPNIVLAENKLHRGRFIVIDGKQRLLSIKDFFDNSLILKGLDIRQDLNGKSKSTILTEDKEFLENSTLRSSLIKNWKDDSFLYAIFYRLNSGSLPLSPQELRKALIGGKLISKIENYVNGSRNFQNIFGVIPDRRMRDSELVIRYIAFYKNYERYDGNLKNFLDYVTHEYEVKITSNSDDLEEIFQILDSALNTAFMIFETTTFKKWTGDKFEHSINRAVFDCIVRFFSDEKVCERSLHIKDDIVSGFKEICLDQNFKNAIEKTTKSVEATHNRIDLWGTKLASLIGMVYESEHGRIL